MDILYAEIDVALFSLTLPSFSMYLDLLEYFVSMCLGEGENWMNCKDAYGSVPVTKT